MKNTRRNGESRTCLSCKRLFIPDPRSRHRQLFCSDPACKKLSKALSQIYWHAKPENRNYWRGPENVRRVQEWRKTHPQYWRRKKAKGQVALQDDMAVPARSRKIGTELLQGAVQGQPKQEIKLTF